MAAEDHGAVHFIHGGAVRNVQGQGITDGKVMSISDSYQLDGLRFAAQVHGFDPPAEGRSVNFRASSFNSYIPSLLATVI